MSFNLSSKSTSPIPVLLLKTRSQPHDAYEEYFSSTSSHTNPSSALDASRDGPVQFQAQCVPVLEHKQNEQTLGELGQLLSSGRFAQRYGGMIFTSQRAVEAWADTVSKIQTGKGDEGTAGVESDLNATSKTRGLNPPTTAHDSRSGQGFETDIFTCSTFPIFVVGPATARAVLSMISSLPSTSPFSRLQWSICGAETGSGAVLAPYILRHYNSLHAHHWFTWHDAPRLPFIPLLGMGSENYSRRRLETDDPLLQKRPLLFLVGEQRRDIIPKTLMDEKLGDEMVVVEEVEVYRTDVKSGFQSEFEQTVFNLSSENGTPPSVVIVVVFSPQGSGDMLRSLGLLDKFGQATEKAKTRWQRERQPDTIGDPATTTTQTASQNNTEPIFVIATIGPTTRDHLVDNFGFEPDVCAQKPSVEGIGEGIREFLSAKGLI